MKVYLLCVFLSSRGLSFSTLHFPPSFLKVKPHWLGWMGVWSSFPTAGPDPVTCWPCDLQDLRPLCCVWLLGLQRTGVSHKDFTRLLSDVSQWSVFAGRAAPAAAIKTGALTPSMEGSCDWRTQSGLWSMAVQLVQYLQWTQVDGSTCCLNGKSAEFPEGLKMKEHVLE